MADGTNPAASPETSCTGIILAAGASSRLGQPKQLVGIEGESLLRRTVRLACEAGCSPLYVVVGANANRLMEEFHPASAIAVVNPEWRIGMASSLRAGLSNALEVNPHLASVMVLVCDQPRLDVSVLRNLIATYRERQPRIAAARYRGIVGVPAIFSQAIFAELMELDGDRGARRIMQLHLSQVVPVEFPGGEIDLDTPEDLAQLHS